MCPKDGVKKQSQSQGEEEGSAAGLVLPALLDHSCQGRGRGWKTAGHFGAWVSDLSPLVAKPQ